MSERVEDIAKKMVQPAMGILAADESTSTIQKRFDSIQVENTVENRQAYRELLFRSDEAMNNYIGGVIMFEETLTQTAKDGTPFVELISGAGAIPGIKVDQGAFPLANHPDETVTEGLDGLRDKLKSYYEAGARFAKWRAVICITDSLPTSSAIHANAHALARYSALCQEQNIVPIVEPEVQMDKEPANHSIQRCQEVTAEVLRVTFEELNNQKVRLEGIVLKPNMVVPGINASKQCEPEEVADKTMDVLLKHVPEAVPGIAFLSGGQSDLEATKNLNAMNAKYDHPWALTFSYGRALQAECLKQWKGDANNLDSAKAAFAHRAKMNSLASLGKYEDNMEAA